MKQGDRKRIRATEKRLGLSGITGFQPGDDEWNIRRIRAQMLGVELDIVIDDVVEGTKTAVLQIIGVLVGNPEVAVNQASFYRGGIWDQYKGMHEFIAKARAIALSHDKGMFLKVVRLFPEVGADTGAWEYSVIAAGATLDFALTRAELIDLVGHPTSRAIRDLGLKLMAKATG